MLHWYAAKKENINPQEYEFLYKFSYKTRYSARDFCEKLITFNNLKPISLGKRILRTETAPLYIMSVLGFIGEQYEN